MFPAPLAELLQFQLLLAHGFGFVGEIIGFFADLALHFYKWFFCHKFYNNF